MWTDGTDSRIPDINNEGMKLENNIKPTGVRKREVACTQQSSRGQNSRENSHTK